MGVRGPVPKRSDQKLGHPTKAGASRTTKAPAGPSREVPASDAKWHPVARGWFESLAKSGQSRFYEPSDWATAYLIAESMTRDLNPQFVGFQFTGKGEQQEAVFETIPLKGASLSAYLKAMSNLLVTEGDRRRVQLELQRGGEVDRDELAADEATNVYRARFGA